MSKEPESKTKAQPIPVQTPSDPKNPHESLAHRLHRFPKVWLAVTAVVVTVSLVVAGVYLKRAYLDDDNTTATNSTNPETVQADVPETTESKVSEATEELKDIDLAALKASVNEVKAIVASFSAQQ